MKLFQQIEDKVQEAKELHQEYTLLHDKYITLENENGCQIVLFLGIEVHKEQVCVKYTTWNTPKDFVKYMPLRKWFNYAGSKDFFRLRQNYIEFQDNFNRLQTLHPETNY